MTGVNMRQYSFSNKGWHGLSRAKIPKGGKWQPGFYNAIGGLARAVRTEISQRPSLFYQTRRQVNIQTATSICASLN
jgi:hypothetical protein